MNLSDFFKNKNKKVVQKESDIDPTMNPMVAKLIECTNLTSNRIMQLVKIKPEKEDELYLFSQWITMYSAIINEVDPEIMNEYYVEHDVKWMIQRKIPLKFEREFSEFRIKKFKEYDEFAPVLHSLFGGKYDTNQTIRLVVRVGNNLLGDEGFDFVGKQGILLPQELRLIMIMHAKILKK